MRGLGNGKVKRRKDMVINKKKKVEMKTNDLGSFCLGQFQCRRGWWKRAEEKEEERC